MHQKIEKLNQAIVMYHQIFVQLHDLIVVDLNDLNMQQYYVKLMLNVKHHLKQEVEILDHLQNLNMQLMLQVILIYPMVLFYPIVMK